MEKIQQAQYVKVDALLHYEFGFILTNENIEVVVIDHVSSYVRTLAYCSTVEDALFALETCIRYGFNEIGLSFEAIPGYQLRRQLDTVEL